MGKMLFQFDVTLGWWMPIYWKHVTFTGSDDDKSQRAEKTYMRPNPSCNLLVHFITEDYKQQAENVGKALFINFNFAIMIPLLMKWNVLVATSITNRIPEAAAMATYMFLTLNSGTGTYEIWGNPYDWVHARNISEAFDSSVPTWVDNGVDIESDFIANEEHAKVTVIRELIYQARAANKWTVTLVDDPRIEYGDILQFVDGNQLYVEDFTRRLERGSEATLEVKGFLISPVSKARGGRPSWKFLLSLRPQSPLEVAPDPEGVAAHQPSPTIVRW